MARLEDKLNSMVAERQKEIQAEVVALQDTMRRSANALEAFKEQCRHEERNITRSETETACACGKVLWSAQKTLLSIESLGIALSEESYLDPILHRQRFERKYKEAEQRFAELQKICEHPKIVHSNRGDPFERECDVCEKDYYEIMREREQSTIVTS